MEIVEKKRSSGGRTYWEKTSKEETIMSELDKSSTYAYHQDISFFIGMILVDRYEDGSLIFRDSYGGTFYKYTPKASQDMKVLEAMVHDLKEESSAYRWGLSEGRKEVYGIVAKQCTCQLKKLLGHLLGHTVKQLVEEKKKSEDLTKDSTKVHRLECGCDVQEGYRCLMHDEP